MSYATLTDMQSDQELKDKKKIVKKSKIYTKVKV